MSATSVIYRRELFAYLKSPWSWAIMSAALFLAGMLFLAMDMSGGEQLSAIVLEKFFWSTSWCTSIAAGLLSIRLVAEDRATGAIVLLNTSPVREVSIVLGKYLAALTFVAVMVALTFYMPLLIKVHGKVTGAQIFVGCFGLFLLAAAVLAIGMFGSALAPNQLIAAVITGGIALGMCILFKLSTILSPPLNSVFASLDLWWIHYQQGSQRGVINLKDVLYYLAVIYFFLLLSVKTLEAKRWQ
jgi:ABC-2 type transport system permease protein